jgi:hypothetical protein
LHSPYGLAVDRANNLYATNSNSDTIQKFTPEGMGSVFASSGLSNPFGLAIDSAGNLYTGNYFGSAIRKFTPAGVGSTFAGAPGIPHFMAILPALSPTAFVAGFATPIPGGTGNFTGFPSAPSISGENVAFVGNGAGIVQGVFAKYGVLTPPQRVADTSTAIPGGSGNFTAFPSAPSISGENVAFVGNGAGIGRSRNRRTTTTTASSMRPTTLCGAKDLAQRTRRPTTTYGAPTSAKPQAAARVPV